VEVLQAHLSKAYECYRGNLLENLPYADWCQEEREHLREILIQVCDRLSQIHFEREEFRLAIPYCERMLEIDPCLEEAYRMLMVCYARGGKRNLAIRQFEKCKRTLHRELSIEPSQLTRDTVLAIQEGKAPSFYPG
jgi:DNA-binding SARP family transcriptional activator